MYSGKEGNVKFTNVGVTAPASVKHIRAASPTRLREGQNPNARLTGAQEVTSNVSDIKDNLAKIIDSTKNNINDYSNIVTTSEKRINEINKDLDLHNKAVSEAKERHLTPPRKSTASALENERNKLTPIKNYAEQQLINEKARLDADNKQYSLATTAYDKLNNLYGTIFNIFKRGGKSKKRTCKRKRTNKRK